MTLNSNNVFRPRVIINDFLKKSSTNKHLIVSAVQLPLATQVVGDPKFLQVMMTKLHYFSKVLYSTSATTTYTYFRVTQQKSQIEIQALSGGRKLNWSRLCYSPNLWLKLLILQLQLYLVNYQFSFKPLDRGTLFSVRFNYR